MTTSDVQNFIKKIKVYYPYFSVDSAEALDEWNKKLKPYDMDDVEGKLEEHLKGDRADEIPKLHFITKYLITTEEKEKNKNDYLIRCNLCGREMFLKEYDTTHYDRCLTIKTLIPILRDRGENVDYETLEEYDTNTLNKVLLKYLPIKKDMKDLL